MSALRKQLEGDLAIRGMSERTRESYVSAVAALANHYGRSPDQIAQEEIQRYLLHLAAARRKRGGARRPRGSLTVTVHCRA